MTTKPSIPWHHAEVLDKAGKHVPGVEVDDGSNEVESIGRGQRKDNIPECRVCHDGRETRRSIVYCLLDSEFRHPDSRKGHVDHQEREEDHGSCIHDS